jgi:hypothetical protein
MDWIDKVELACALVLGAVLIVMMLHFTYSVTLDIRQAEWWPSLKDRCWHFKENCVNFFSDLKFFIRGK